MLRVYLWHFLEYELHEAFWRLCSVYRARILYKRSSFLTKYDIILDDLCNCILKKKGRNNWHKIHFCFDIIRNQSRSLGEWIGNQISSDTYHFGVAISNYPDKYMSRHCAMMCAITSKKRLVKLIVGWLKNRDRDKKNNKPPMLIWGLISILIFCFC